MVYHVGPPENLHPPESTLNLPSVLKVLGISAQYLAATYFSKFKSSLCATQHNTADRHSLRPTVIAAPELVGNMNRAELHLDVGQTCLQKNDNADM